ncbi:MAG: phenylalanine--tRNA ligase subunit beta [Nitrospirae bacterium]|nr:phenylalanine--tRNA ligase subunit beta [Nitrospirota bacterium]
MPTITVIKNDLENLLKKKFTIGRLEDYLKWTKGEVKGYDEKTDEIKLELNDSNRPDLWCAEGIARQIRWRLTNKKEAYPFLNKKTRNELIVSKELKDIRPYVAACTATGIKVTDNILTQLIQTQEKLSYIFGRKRHGIAIGVYNLEKIRFPIYYKAVNPDDVSFVPLGFEEKMNLNKILSEHPKGKEFGGILNGKKLYPLLTDSENKILSFPPIINSREIGEVKVGDKNLFIEATGTDIRLVILAINIMAANLSDRGAKIEPVQIKYPYTTELGKATLTPLNFSEIVTISHADIEKALGETWKDKDIKTYLTNYGYEIKIKNKKIAAVPPFFRDDLMHPMDVIEDLAISKGYDTFKPIMPHHFTVGSLSDIEFLSDKVRELFVGIGFQEIISNILTSKNELLTKMNLPDERLVEISNVMSESYSVLRNSLVPSLLRVEAESSKAFYPHKIFEVGEAAVYDENDDMGSSTILNAACLISHPNANFSEMHSYLDILFYYLNLEYKLEPFKHPSFIDGRVGRVIVKNETIGLIGEIHPEVIEKWGINCPCACVEISVNKILNLKR